MKSILATFVGDSAVLLHSDDDDDDDGDGGTTNVCVFQEEFSDYEANDPWVQNLIFNLDGLLTSFKVSSVPLTLKLIDGHFTSLQMVTV